MTISGRAISAWLDGRDEIKYPPLEATAEADVVVIGGGIVGLSAAYELQQAGAEVALLEARTIASGVSGNTTAKLSSLHGLSYASIRSSHGAATARAYAEMNQWGLGRIQQNAKELGIDCDLRRRPNFTYTEGRDRAQQLQEECEAASEAGLPVGLTTSTDLPFQVAGAIRCEDQAQFHPVKYLRGLAEGLRRDGAAVHERTRVVDVGGDRVLAESGAVVRAGRTVVATHLPFLDRGLFFARASAQRSYAISVRIEGPMPQAMYLQAEPPGRSLRAIPWEGRELLMVGGQSHRVGHGDARGSFEALERYARERFDVIGIEHRWDAHDYMPDDGLPYIGRLLPTSDRILTATGMRKWGLAMGTGAAKILADRVSGQDNAWSSVFDPWRVPTLNSVKEAALHNADSGLHFFVDRLARTRSVSDLEPGEGRVVGSGLGQRAVHRDRDGVLRAVSARCTHLGCIVRWNGADGTWDCPCHGSRFEATGEVINGPATSPLTSEEQGG